MGAFEGTWKGAIGYDTITVHLKVAKIYYNMDGGFYWDNIVGWHQYKRGPIVIESSYQNIGNTNLRTFIGGNENNINQLDGLLKDIRKNKRGKLSLTLVSSVTPNQLVWKLENTEGVRVRTNPNQAPYDWGFTLPENMVLTKQ